MKGIEIFYEEAKKRDYRIGETSVKNDDKNGDFEITNAAGRTTVQNFKKIAEIYGILAFYHFEPEEAIDQIFEFIEAQMNNTNINE